MGEFYSSSSKGVGGRIKQRIEDFIVEEVSLEGEKVRVKRFVERFEREERPLEWLDKVLGEGEHLRLDMEKFNYDMNLAVRRLARFLQCSRERIGYAGMKDKRSVSAQRITVYKPGLELVKAFTNNSIELRNPVWVRDRIELGDLKGNSFNVIIRDIGLGEKEARERLETLFGELREKGVANLFGVQRFQEGMSADIGKAVINKDFEKAVKLYLCSPRSREDREASEARKALEETRDYSRASKEFPVKLRFERAMIHYLCKHPEDHIGALRELPKRLRIMFTHALQSRMFNKMLEERIKRHGLEPVEGEALVEGIPSLPLAGFKTVLDKGEIGEIEARVLKGEGLDQRDFYVREMKEMSSKGGQRKIVFHANDLKLSRVFEDEYNQGRLAVEASFWLEKGCYATTLLREITKQG